MHQEQKKTIARLETKIPTINELIDFIKLECDESDSSYCALPDQLINTDIDKLFSVSIENIELILFHLQEARDFLIIAINPTLEA